MENKVFLGGTCNESHWRETLIPKLTVDYFNPVVDDWTPECQIEEERQKNEVCKYQLYVITPKMKGVFSIAEAVESTINHPDRTIFCVYKEDDDRDWDEGERRSLKATENLIKRNGGIVCSDLDKVAETLTQMSLISEILNN